MPIAPEIIDEIRERTSLAELVSETVQLKQAGRRWSGLCPFHNEKTPSFSVNDDEGLYLCFGCGAKGDLFGYVQETKGFSFPEAVRFLAGRAGIAIPESRPDMREAEERNSKQKRRCLELTYKATKAYRRLLREESKGAQGRAYLADRGISDATIKAFYLGFAPDSWEFIRSAVEQEKTPGQVNADDQAPEESYANDLVVVGLLKQRNSRSDEAQDKEKESSRGYYDSFRNRIIFPITRSDGVPIAFGGRALSKDDNTPKYINSSESPIYIKRRSFFGLSQAREAIRKSRHVYMVEGYLDVLSLYQRGFQNTVATCGTAVTEEHAQILRRLVDKVTIIFDGDDAGRAAAAKCFGVFLNQGLEVRVVHPPVGEDPDTLAQRLDRGELEGFFESNSRLLVDVYLDTLLSGLAEGDEQASAAHVGKQAAQFATTIAKVQNPVEREHLLKRASDRFDVSIESLAELVAQAVQKQSAQSRAPSRERNDRAQASSYSTRSLAQKVSVRDTSASASAGISGPQHRYTRLLIIAVISEPKLSKAALELPSLLEGVEPIEIIPQQVQAFLEALAKSDCQGVADRVADELAQTAAGKPSLPHNHDDLRAVLEQFGFAADEYLQEARRQCRIGGASPRAVIESLGSLSAREALGKDMESIRQQEHAALGSKQETLQDLAQKKLLKRRNLESIREQH